MKKYLFLLFSIFLFIPKTYALENFDTNYNISIPDITALRFQYVDNNETMTYYDLFEHLISLHEESSYNNPLFISFDYNSNDNITGFYVGIARDYTISYNFTPYGLSSSSYSTLQLIGTDNYYIGRNYKFYSSNKPNNISTNSDYISLINCISLNNCKFNTNLENSFSSMSSSGTILNSSGFTFDFSTHRTENSNIINNHLLYYSSRPISFSNKYSSNNNVFYKNLIINDKSYSFGSILPDYRTLYFSSNNIKDISIGNIYIGQVPKNNINDFKFTSSFYYTDYNYVNSLQPRILFFGRIPHTGYYSYEQINCSSDIINTISINQESKKANFTLFPNGFSCSSDLSNYDNIYMRVYFLNSSSNTEILGFNGSSNYGRYYRLSDTQATSINAYIYEYFDSLPNNFSFVLSTLSDEIKAYYLTDSSYVGSVHINKDTNKLDSIIYNPISYGTANNKNVMIYNMSNYYDGLTHLDLFLNYNTIISSIDSSTGNYTFYNNSGVLTTDTIINNHTLVYDNSYDTSYYNNIVSGFIDSLSLDIDNFSSIIQQAYDLAPPFLQLFIYSVFILFCLYMLYKLIKRW